MIESDDCRTYVEHMRNEHVHIDQSLLELQRLLSQAGEVREQTAAPLLARLKNLRADLQRHFVQEEEGGCLEEARSRLPRLSQEVGMLQAQHADLLASLDAVIVQAAEGLAAQTAELESLQAAYHEFQERLHAHESEENRILLLSFGSPAMESLSI